jgi:hypothetical protein
MIYQRARFLLKSLKEETTQRPKRRSCLATRHTALRRGGSKAPTHDLDQWYSTFFVRVPPDIISLQLCTNNFEGIV